MYKLKVYTTNEISYCDVCHFTVFNLA